MQHKTSFYRRGFTVVELAVVIVVIGILTTVATIGVRAIQQNQRDSVRGANASAIAESLEKYYAKHGEYPTAPSLTNTDPSNTGATVSSKLNLEPGLLVIPGATNTTTNSLRATPDPSTDYYAYQASSEVNESQ